MRYLFILSIALLFSCQSAVRYTAIDDGAYYNHNNHGSDSAVSAEGKIKTARMGKIIAGYLRIPYKKGGRDKSGIDCSGLTYVVYRDYNGSSIPKTVAEQYQRLKPVEYDNLSYGDLVFFSFNGNQVTHVGLYIQNDKFVHASESEGVVVSSLKEKYYKKAYRGARRVFN